MDKPLPSGCTFEGTNEHGEVIYAYYGWRIQADPTGEVGYIATIANPDDVGDEGAEICAEWDFDGLNSLLSHATRQIDEWRAGRDSPSAEDAACG